MFFIGSSYSKNDIYRILDVHEQNQKGAWDTGYRKWNEDIFIFANIGIPGRTGYNHSKLTLPEDQHSGSQTNHCKSLPNWTLLYYSVLHQSVIIMPVRGSGIIFLREYGILSTMTALLDRIKVYSLYFYEYLRYAEFNAASNAVMYMVTRKAYSPGKQIKTRMGTYETRKGTLDFQYVNYAYEIDLKHFIEKQKFDVFFDVGACLGEYCIWLGKQGYRCFAFEPVYDSYKMISRNIQLNNVTDRVKAYNFGLGQKHSIEHFELNTINPGGSRRVEEPTATTHKFEIEAMDNIFHSLDLKPETRILMKIDIEGMEVEMLKGSENFFRFFNNVTLIIEEKISGESEIIKTLNSICHFEYGHVDRFNIYAKKIGNIQSN